MSYRALDALLVVSPFSMGVTGRLTGRRGWTVGTPSRRPGDRRTGEHSAAAGWATRVRKCPSRSMTSRTWRPTAATTAGHGWLSAGPYRSPTLNEVVGDHRWRREPPPVRRSPGGRPRPTGRPPRVGQPHSPMRTSGRPGQASASRDPSRQRPTQQGRGLSGDGRRRWSPR